MFYSSLFPYYSDMTKWIDAPFYNKIKENMPLPCVDLLVVNHGKLLLMLRNNEPAKDLWFTPGGRIYKDEKIEDTVTRVLVEETGLKPITITQVATMGHHWPNTHTVTTYYIVRVASDKIKMNNEHREYKWVAFVDESAHPYLIEMIEKANIF